MAEGLFGIETSGTSLLQMYKTMNLDELKRWGDMSSESEEEQESKNTQEDDDDDDEDAFLPLPPKRANKARFPPECHVLVGQARKLHLNANENEEETTIFLPGTVLQVVIHLDNHETMYKIQLKDKAAKTVTVKEEDLQFSVGTTIWCKTNDKLERGIVTGSQETISSFDSLGLELFATSLLPSLTYSVQLNSTAGMMMGTTISKHGVLPQDVTFRRSSEKENMVLSANDVPTATKDQDVMNGLLALVEPSDSSVNQKSIKKGEEQANLRWADVASFRTNNGSCNIEKSPPLLIRSFTDSTASSESPEATPTWTQIVHKASNALKLGAGQQPPAADLVLLTSLGPQKPKSTLPPKTHVSRGLPTKTEALLKPTINKSIELPSLAFGKQFLIDSISGKDGSGLKALWDEFSCTIDFEEAIPEGAKRPSLMAQVKGPSLLKIAQCTLAIEEKLYYAVPPRLRGCLLAKLGVHNDYREERSGVVWSHNPFTVPDHVVVNDGSHLRHIAILKAGPTSKPGKGVIGFPEAKRWKVDMKHRFPTCAISLVDASDYWAGFPSLSSHIVLSGPRYREVLKCREELLARLKHGR